MSLLKMLSRQARPAARAATPHLRSHWPRRRLDDRTAWPPSPGERSEAKQALIEQAKARPWFHTIDLGGGHLTPGPQDAQVDHIRKAFLDIDFRGKKVLDIGCWDGLWSFEAEKRGAAEVYSTDLVSQRGGDVTNYRLAHAILGSRARYFPTLSVYDVHQLGETDFDVVIYMGVFYHIKDPLLAFARLRQVTKEGGLIIVEGEAIQSDDCFAKFYFHEDYAQSASNWWVPTIPCLRQWVECSSFRIEGEYTERDGDPSYWRQRKDFGRHLITARAVPVPMQDVADQKNYYSRYDFLD
jgi:tRNA (mo5U34)-methyltransferase